MYPHVFGSGDDSLRYTYLGVIAGRLVHETKPTTFKLHNEFLEQQTSLERQYVIVVAGTRGGNRDGHYKDHLAMPYGSHQRSARFLYCMV